MNEAQKDKEQGLSAWQLAMMALGTVVGGSFFLGSAVAIRAAGPSVLIAYVIGGLLVYWILSALSELTVAKPAAGSFRTYAEEAFGAGAGFTVGWVYWTGLVLAMSSEAIAASTLLRGWLPNVPIPLIGAVIIIAVTLLNLLGAKRLGKLESGLAAIKLVAIAAFILLAVLLVAGLFLGGTGRTTLTASPLTEGLRELSRGTWFIGGLRGIAGSMLMVMFTYAGFEVLGLAAADAKNPQRTIPQAINRTILLLVGLYIGAMISLFLLVPTSRVSEAVSPFVTALSLHGFGWAGTVMNLVLVTAILSTMLASVFGLGRMLRSLGDEGHAPEWMHDKMAVPRRGILVSGAAMLAALGLGVLLPQNVYLFLVSSGGFTLLFAYTLILLSHYRLRRRNGHPLAGKYGLRGFPYTSWIASVSLVAIMLSMPLIPGQGSGLAAGILLVLLFGGGYALGQARRTKGTADGHPVLTPSSAAGREPATLAWASRAGYSIEMAEELTKEQAREQTKEPAEERLGASADKRRIDERKPDTGKR
ncbi:amino acid permease [Gorillibacterium timonense]|uniref:amino acid permease n=1 Tax=Gorillibacterium timonense TaxID=1689269 RepID=UPI0009E67559|nr:amino acid permease [Gorillibacterium timonense]